MQIIPLTSDPNQSFQSTITIDGSNVTLQFNIRFNDIASYWVMTITDPKINKIILDSIPMLCDENGNGNILSQHSYLGIGAAYIVNVSGAVNLTDSNLGTDFVLVWGDTIP